MKPEPCSCGCTEPHQIARRTTADGVRLAVWSDGAVTLAVGIYLRGLGIPRSAWARATRARAVRLVMGDLEMFDATEIPPLVKAAEATYRHTWSSDHDRRAFVLSRFPLSKGSNG